MLYVFGWEFCAVAAWLTHRSLRIWSIVFAPCSPPSINAGRRMLRAVL